MAHAVRLAKEFLGKDKFVVYLGDNLLKGGIVDHVSAFNSSTSEAWIPRNP